jgi:2-enoate reductase
MECLEEIRNRIGDRLAVVYRFGLKHYLKNSSQGALPGEVFEEAGRDVAEGVEMAKKLESAGFDALHVDAGCYESHYWPHPPIYQKHGCMVDMAAKAREVVSIPVIGVGRLDKPEVAAHAVSEGMVDAVAIGRGLLADPRWADKIRFGDARDIRPCVGCYDGCFEAYSKYRNISCALNPASGRERAYRLEPALNPRNVMVIGGGVAGMEAARVAAIRGHRVSLYEKGKKLGGLVRRAAKPEFKKDLRRLLAWYERQIEKSGISVMLEREVSLGDLQKDRPDVVIIATGAKAIVPAIPGVDLDSVVMATDFLKAEEKPGTRILIMGGGLAGCEVAIWQAQMGREVILVEMLPNLMSGGPSVPTQVAPREGWFATTQ